MTLETRIFEHLNRLVDFDTTNPPRLIKEDGLFAYVQKNLPDFHHTVWNYGQGRISLLSVRGTPDVLFNFHIDTVPASDAWTQDPWTLMDCGDRVSGLGSCDIKGASACMLAVAAHTPGDVALLFTSDEEAGNSHCVREFIAHHNTFRRVIVAEPTQAQAVLAHRGIITATVNFKGVAGHASAQQGVGASAVHQAIDWGQRALAWAAGEEQQSFQNLQGLRFNIGTIKGGIKPNMIAPTAELKFGLRSLPGMQHADLLASLRSVTDHFDAAELTPGFDAPALNGNADSLAGDYQLPVGPAVDFWTEAALFGAASVETLVFGPGDIAQAHTADEWVSKAQLFAVAQHYERMIQHGGA